MVPNVCCGYIDPIVSKLPIMDQAEFFRLVQFFAYTDDRNKRNLGIPTFIKHLNVIHQYVCRGDKFDTIRGLAAGIQFGKGIMLINTSRLKKLMNRSKSCMNGCFQKLGYNTTKPNSDISGLFASLFSCVGIEHLNPRQWCIRRAGQKVDTLFTPNISYEIKLPETSEQSSAPNETDHKIDSTFDLRFLLNRKENNDGILRML